MIEHSLAVQRLVRIQHRLKRDFGARFNGRHWFGFTSPIPWEQINVLLADERAAISHMMYHVLEHRRICRRRGVLMPVQGILD